MMVDQVVLSCPTHNADALSRGQPMSALALFCLIFVLTLGGILLGTLLRRALPEHHLSEGSPGRGAAWCRPDRNNSRACARLTYRRREEFIRHAKHSDHTDHCRYDPARQLACGVWAASPPDPRTNAQYHWPACRPALAREAGQHSGAI